MSETFYSIKTSRKYDVSLPDVDGEIEIDWDGDKERIWLNKEDVLKLLERFD